MFARLAVRDALIIAATLVGWHYGAHWSAESGMRGDIAGVVLGAAVATCFLLLHEWGHLLGALATASRVHAPRKLMSRFLFSFDTQANSRRQFAIMSLSGFVVTAIAVAFVYTRLPSDLLATRVARGLVMLLASLTVFLEVPLLLYGLFARALPPIEVFERPDAAGDGAATCQRG